MRSVSVSRPAKAGLVLRGGSWAESEELQAGFEDRDGGFEFVRGVPSELALALECLSQAF